MVRGSETYIRQEDQSSSRGNCTESRHNYKIEDTEIHTKAMSMFSGLCLPLGFLRTFVISWSGEVLFSFCCRSMSLVRHVRFPY
jgi:hypothetical protein